MKAPAAIETARLVLVRPALADAQAVFDRYASDPEVTRYLGWPRHETVADTELFLHFAAEQWERWPAGPYLIRDAASDRLLGSTGLGFDRADIAATGYVLARDAWGRGYATEALAAMVDLARDLEIRLLYALCHPEHRASWRVLEKCGFDHDSSWTRQVAFPNLQRGEPQDVVCYSRSFDEDETAA